MNHTTRPPAGSDNANTHGADTTRTGGQPWQRLLDDITALGVSRGFTNAPPPTDDDLRTWARHLGDTALGTVLDDAQLAELRAAYDDGRQPSTIDLDEVALLVRQAGHETVVEQAGGNNAVLYAGRRYIGPEGWARWSVAAGPGWFRGPGQTRPAADTTDFAIGPDDGDDWQLTVPTGASAAGLADVIVAVITDVDAQQERFVRAAASARDAMWQAFAAAYPEAINGDLAPGEDHALVRASNEVFGRWLRHNLPHDIPTHLAHLSGVSTADGR
ncbi:hypothetical protein [Rugosimonospora africana]|uniref:Uncharacterized protein n=1 Tax=Rugosimonospora africana TaxID=556532 RepID=A0A8J3VRF1_9ACTN|nr:hypothetical protein [Rugosimonospora africana]GIH16120.1 hypothetical protein Raf01_42920 [Rugosimonospora africana]